jgi:hypothetical protein
MFEGGKKNKIGVLKMKRETKVRKEMMQLKVLFGIKKYKGDTRTQLCAKS